MQYRQLGSSDLKVSEISLGSWLTYGVGVEADAARACLDEAFAAGHQLHRHRQRLWPRGGGDVPRPGAEGAAARQLCAGDQALFPDDRQRPGAVPRAGGKAARRVAAAAADRLCRSLSVPPLRLGDAARGDDGSADACGRQRQGALHRFLGMAGGADPGGARHGGRASSCRASRNIRWSGASPRTR